MNIEVGKEYVSGNTFYPSCDKVLAVTADTVTLYRATSHPKIRRYTLPRYVFEATSYETVEQMITAYESKKGAV